jgi:hypothetical protein
MLRRGGEVLLRRRFGTLVTHLRTGGTAPGETRQDHHGQKPARHMHDGPLMRYC